MAGLKPRPPMAKPVDVIRASWVKYPTVEDIMSVLVDHFRAIDDNILDAKDWRVAAEGILCLMKEKNEQRANQ